MREKEREDTSISTERRLERRKRREDTPCRATAFAVAMLSPLNIQTSFPIFLSCWTVASASTLGGSAMANLAQTANPAGSEDTERLLIPTRTMDLASLFQFSTSSTSVSSGVTAPIWYMKASFPMQTSNVSVFASGRERTRTPLSPRPVNSSLDPVETQIFEG